MTKYIVIVLMCATLTLQAAFALDNKIIVQPITNSTGDENLDPLSTGFSDLLVVYLSGYKGLEILYREDLHKIWQELAQTMSSLEEADALKVGMLIQANKLIKGGFVKINGSFQANVHIYDIETTKLQHSIEEIGDIENVDVIASNMARIIANRLLNATSTAPSPSPDAQPLVNTHFMKGLGYYYSGLYDHAAAEFMQVMDLDPARADARMWLGKSYYTGGEHDHAQIEYKKFLKDFPDHKEAENVQIALDKLSHN